MRPDQRRGAAPKKTRACLVDAADIAFHVTRINDVGSLFDDFPVMLFDMMTLRQSSHFDQELFVKKRYVKIVVGARGQSFQRVLVRLAIAANQQDGNASGSRIQFQLTA